MNDEETATDPDYGYDWMHVIAPEPGGGDCDSDFDDPDSCTAPEPYGASPHLGGQHGR